MTPGEQILLGIVILTLIGGALFRLLHKPVTPGQAAEWAVNVDLPRLPREYRIEEPWPEGEGEVVELTRHASSARFDAEGGFLEVNDERDDGIQAAGQERP